MGEWGFKALKQMVKITFSMVGAPKTGENRPLGRFRRDDGTLPPTVEIYQISGDQELFGEVDQLHLGLYFDLEADGSPSEILSHYFGCIKGLSLTLWP